MVDWTTMSELHLDLVRHALGAARRNGYVELELSIGDATFSARLQPGPRPSPAAVSQAEASAGPEFQTIASTLVGYYREAKKPLQVGETVAKGDVVAVIAALGIANDVESKVTGEVIEVLVTPGQAVEYGQPLARVKP